MGYIEVVHEPIGKGPATPPAPPKSMVQILFGTSGRLRRGDFWLYGFASIFIFGIPLLVFYGYGMSGELEGSIFSIPLALLGLLLTIAGAWSWCFALPIKRLHDTNHSGFWVFLSFVGPLCFLLYLYLACKGGSSGSNDYGIDPKLAACPSV